MDFLTIGTLITAIGNGFLYQAQFDSGMAAHSLFLFLALPVPFVIGSLAYARWFLPDAQRKALSAVDGLIMGASDCGTTLLLMLGSNWLRNPRLTFALLQSSIPLSMLLSFVMLGTRYSMRQLLGASLVCTGIAALVAWSEGGGSASGASSASPVAVATVMLAAVPNVLGSMYKNRKMNTAAGTSPVYVNGIVTLYQTLLAVAAVPLVAPLMDVEQLNDVPHALWDGMVCALGGSAEPGAHEAASTAHCQQAPAVLVLYIIANTAYNVFLMELLKRSAPTYFIVSCAVFPLNNLLFGLLPSHKPPSSSDVVSLCLIFAGLVIFRSKSMSTKLKTK